MTFYLAILIDLTVVPQDTDRLGSMNSLNYLSYFIVTAQDTAARVAELEAENRRFRQELEEYRAEASNLKNQQARFFRRNVPS